MKKNDLIKFAKTYFVVNKPYIIACGCENIDCQEKETDFKTINTQNIPQEVLRKMENDPAYLANFSSEGFKFVFPSLISYVMEGDNFPNSDLYLHLLWYLELPSINKNPQLHKYQKEKFETFTPEQNKIIYEFLKYSFDNDHFFYEQKTIQHALDRWWEKADKTDIEKCNIR